MLADVGMVAIFQPHDELMRPGAFGRLDHLRVRGRGTAVAYVVDHRAGEEMHVLLHHADVSAQRVQRVLAHVLAVEEDSPGRDFVKAGDKTAQRAFAAAGRPDQSHAFAGGHVQVDVREYVFMPFLVGKADVVEGDVALDDLHIHGARRVVDLHRHFHHLDEALDAGQTAHELLGKLDQTADGGQQRLHEQYVGDVVCGGDAALAADEEQRAQKHHHDEHQPVKQPRHRVEARHVVVHLALDAQKAAVALGKLFLFQLLIGKGLDHADAGERVLHLRVEFAQLVAGLLVGGAHAPGKADGEVDHEGEDGEDDQR